MAQGQLNGPRKFARATFSCQGRLRGKAPHPDKKMWAWQIFLAHLVGPGPFLASGQLSLVVRGVRENEGFLEFATFFGKGACWVKLGRNVDIWDQNGGAKKTRAEKLCRKVVECCQTEPRRPNIDPKTMLDSV